MDRRRLKSRSGLHLGLHGISGSQASSKDEEPLLSGSSRHSSIRGSQKLSNSELLRRKTRSVTDTTENLSAEKEAVEKPSSVKSTKMQFKSRRSAQNESSTDEDSIEEVQSPVKTHTKTSSLRKHKKVTSVLTENEKTAEKPPAEKLLSKRKRLAGKISDSDSDQENTTTGSPLKLRRVDPRVVSQRIENSKNAEQRAATQIARPSQITLRKSTQKQSNSGLLKKLTSPLKTNDVQDKMFSPVKKTSRNKLEEFFKRSGVILSQDNGPHQSDENPTVISNKMAQLLSSGRFKREEIIDLWKVYISDEANLRKCLDDVMFVSTEQLARSGASCSLIRIILQVAEIQTAVCDNLLQKLNESVLIADRMEDVPWSSLLLQQFRFLEVVVDTDSLTLRLEELLETCPIWFQRELILFLPDIVIDAQHHAIAEMLSKLMETQIDLTSVILDCITNLTLGKEYLEELREKILDILKSTIEVDRIPAMARFVLYGCPSVDICEKTLTVLRKLDLQPLGGEKSEQYSKSQTFFVRELRMSILSSKTMSKAARSVVKATEEPPKPLDLIILLLVYSDKAMKKIAEGILRQHIKTGFYRASLLNTFYHDYREVSKDLQSESLHLASTLLKSEDRAFADFAIEWFRCQFSCQADTVYKQREIIEKVILLMGNNDETAKGALSVLRRLTETEMEMKYLQSHCNHLRILLEKIDNFDLQEVATLSDLLYALCTSNDTSSEALLDDLFILLQKQLANAKTSIKCKGVLGAVMAIKHLAGKPDSCKIAKDLVLKIQAGVKNCPRSRALFYDEIGNVIADTKNIETTFLQDITDKFQEEFIDTYMTDTDDYKGELRPKFGLNEAAKEPQKCVINFGDGKYGAVVPAFFRLLRICFMRLSDGNLEDINVLLGCPVLLPQEMDVAEAWSLDLMICCINWFRELISAFVSQPDSILQEQVVKRLENLMSLQAEFSGMLAMADNRYQPPPCYFRVFPAPSFIRVEKKTTKKGKRASVDKTVAVPEWEAWEIGSSLCSKNTTYFRRLDAKVVDLLDLKMDQDKTQTPAIISKAQICFLIKELLGMFEGGNPSETLLRDLVHLLPKICSKLQEIVGELREQDDMKNRHAAKLILTLLTTIFEWKGFRSPKYHALLRDGLRTLACQIDKKNSMLRSSKELVAESYKYFESLADVSTDVSLAFAVVKVCRSLMKHSDTFTQQFKNKQANLASGFLALQWPDDKSTGTVYKTAVVGFLASWMQNEPNPLETVTTVLEWLPEEVSHLEKSQDRLERMPAITKAIFHNMFQKLFEGLINGVKIALKEASTDPERIKVWQTVGCNVKKIVEICKNSARTVLLPFLRSMTSLLRIFLSSGMPIMEQNLRFQTEEVTGIMKMMQGGTRYLNAVCVDCTEKKDMTLAKIVPPAKQLTEKLLYLVKGMLVYNNSSDAFWMGNLVNKNLEGQEIISQSSTDEPTSENVDVSLPGASDDEARSEILESDVEDQVSDEDS